METVSTGVLHVGVWEWRAGIHQMIHLCRHLQRTIKSNQAKAEAGTGAQQRWNPVSHTSEAIKKKRVTHPVCSQRSDVWKADKRAAIHYSKCWKRPEEEEKSKTCTPTAAMSAHSYCTHTSINHPDHNRDTVNNILRSRLPTESVIFCWALFNRFRIYAAQHKLAFTNVFCFPWKFDQSFSSHK